MNCKMSNNKILVGILGVGQIAQFILEGLDKAKANYDFILSPRSKKKSEELANKYNYAIAKSNQDLINRSDKVLICLPASSSEETIRNLIFRENQNILSVMAGVNRSTLLNITESNFVSTAMMPGYANAMCDGLSALYPLDQYWNNFLSHLGPVITLETEQEFKIAATFGALSGVSFVFFQQLIKWYESKGLSNESAKFLVLKTLTGNIKVVESSKQNINSIISAVSPEGGITKKMVRELEKTNSFEGWDKALDEILNSISK